MKYIIITPAYNEEKYIETLISSVLKQTILPAEWIIVNDGSTDRTGEIAESYCRKLPWMRLINKEKSPAPFGANVIQNFYAGFNQLLTKDWDFVVKLDADLDLMRPDYFEFQIRKMEEDASLGLCSGITFYTTTEGIQKIVWHPPWRTTGALKLYRRSCFDAIGGITPIFGWDGLDEYKCMHRGWKSQTFYELKVHHLAKHVSFQRRNPEYYRNKGKSYFIRGYPFEFVLIKIFHWLILGKFKQSSYLFSGYLRALTSGESQVVSRDEKRFIRRFQYKRLFRIK